MTIFLFRLFVLNLTIHILVTVFLSILLFFFMFISMQKNKLYIAKILPILCTLDVSGHLHQKRQCQFVETLMLVCMQKMNSLLFLSCCKDIESLLL